MRYFKLDEDEFVRKRETIVPWDMTSPYHNDETEEEDEGN